MAMIFRFAGGFKLRNPPAHGMIFLLIGAAAVLTTDAALHLLMKLTGHGDKQTLAAIHHSVPLNPSVSAERAIQVYPRIFPGIAPDGPGSSALNSSKPFGPGDVRAPKPSLPQRRLFSVLRPALRRGGVRLRGGVAERERCVKGKTGGAP